jgi:hypothetical protein
MSKLQRTALDIDLREGRNHNRISDLMNAFLEKHKISVDDVISIHEEYYTNISRRYGPKESDRDYPALLITIWYRQ